MKNKMMEIFAYNNKPIIKDDQFPFFKTIIRKHYHNTFSRNILEDELESIIVEYSILRDNLKMQMFNSDKIPYINTKNLDIHKIAACLTLAIYRKMKTIPTDSIKNIENMEYSRVVFGYTLSLFLLKIFIEKNKNIKISNELPIFHFNTDRTYDEFLFSLIYNKEKNTIFNDNIECLHTLSHIYYLIQELYYSQNTIS
jgi:hypothetical protein